MKEQLITIETARLAKEKGFQIIRKNSELTRHDLPGGVLITGHSLPTQSLVQKWLREEHGLIIHINPKEDGTPRPYKFNYSIAYNLYSHYKQTVGNLNAATYESALEKALVKGLELIKQPI